jgi:hypothetical protein
MATEEEKKAKRKAEKAAKKAAKGGKKKPQQAAAPATNYSMPAPAGAPTVAGPNAQLDQALAMPMPDISALLAQSGRQDMESKNAMLNSGLIRGLRRDAYGDVQTGSRNPWKNGTFGTPEQVAQRANAGYEQRMKELARPAGQYNIPKPQATLPAPDFVPRGGVNGVQNLQDNWNQGIAEMPMAGPKTQDQFVAEINAKYPALASIGARPDMPVQPPATVPSESALAYVRESLDPVYATEQQRLAAGYQMPQPAPAPEPGSVEAIVNQIKNNPTPYNPQAPEWSGQMQPTLQQRFANAPGSAQSDGTGIPIFEAMNPGFIQQQPSPQAQNWNSLMDTILPPASMYGIPGFNLPQPGAASQRLSDGFMKAGDIDFIGQSLDRSLEGARRVPEQARQTAVQLPGQMLDTAVRAQENIEEVPSNIFNALFGNSAGFQKFLTGRSPKQ